MNLIHTTLQWAWTYRLSQRFWYKSGQQQAYLTDWVKPSSGDRVLDIGCGPASLLQWMPEVEYVGYDPNPHYIQNAQKRYPKRARFTCGHLMELPQEFIGSFDRVLMNGVLHHIDNSQAEHLLSLAHRALKAGGRLITRDGCYEENQNALARLLLKWDRGTFVRTQAGYETLLRTHFNLERVEIRRDVLRLPYSLIHCSAVRR